MVVGLIVMQGLGLLVLLMGMAWLRSLRRQESLLAERRRNLDARAVVLDEIGSRIEVMEAKLKPQLDLQTEVDELRSRNDELRRSAEPLRKAIEDAQLAIVADAQTVQELRGRVKQVLDPFGFRQGKVKLVR